MPDPHLTWSAEHFPDGILRIAFAGRAGIGSDGNPDGEWMRRAIREALAEYRPASLVIDLRNFEYRFGDWIGAVAVTALVELGTNRVCLVASGATAAAMHSLWTIGKLDRLSPLFGELSEARSYLTHHGSERHEM